MAATTTLMLKELLAVDSFSRLSELLTPETSVVINCGNCDRIPSAFIAAALAATEKSQGYLRLEELSTLAQVAIAMVDSLHRLAIPVPARTAAAVGERPFNVQLARDGHLEITLLKSVGQHPYMNDPQSHEWVRALEIPSVIIDLGQIEHLSSLLVAWLLQINQGVGMGRCQLKHVGRQAAAQLNQLRLNHLLKIIE